MSSNSPEKLLEETKIDIYDKPYNPRINYELFKIDYNNTTDEYFSGCSSDSSSPNHTTKDSVNKNTDENEQQLKYRTELCKFYEINGQCKFGNNCIFAHGRENLRQKVLNKSGYKKRPCINFFEQGICLYGNRCQFSHQIKNDLNNNDKVKFSYKEFLENVYLGKIKNTYDIKHRSRLCVFQNITRNNTNNNSLSDKNKIPKRKIIFPYYSRNSSKDYFNHFDYLSDILKTCKSKKSQLKL